jgi:hypothetical protein
MIVNRFTCSVSSACPPSWNRGLLDHGVERPARSRCRIEPVGQAQTKALDTGPGNHCRVVGAQLWRWRDKPQPAVSREGCQMTAQTLVGSNAAGGDQAFSVWVIVTEPSDCVCRSIGQRVADSVFD